MRSSLEAVDVCRRSGPVIGAIQTGFGKPSGSLRWRDYPAGRPRLTSPHQLREQLLELLGSSENPLGRSLLTRLHEPLTLSQELVAALGRLDMEREHLLEAIEPVRLLWHRASIPWCGLPVETPSAPGIAAIIITGAGPGE
jgi:hypothetical protein